MRLSRELTHLAQCLATVAGLPGPGWPTKRDIRWKRWLQLVEEHQLGALLSGRWSADWNLPPDVESQLQERYVRAGNAAAVQTIEFLRTLRALNGVAEAVVLKGAALVPVLYREAAERSMWDIDLLFRSPEDQEKARALLEQRGCRARRNLRGHHHLPALVNPVNKMAFELHLNLVTPPLAQGFMDEIWQKRRRIEQAPVPNFYVLDDAALLAHQCIHALNDPIESPLLRSLFEIAWLASRLDAAGQTALKDLAARWGIGTIVGRGLWLAADVFGSPTLLERPPCGAYEFWSRARLGWCDYRTPWQKWRRHVAAAHVVHMLEGASDRNVLTPLGIAVRDTWNAVRARVVQRFSRSEAPPRRGSMPSAVLGDTILLFDERSGETHLLNRLAAKVWQATDGQLSADGIAELLESEGVSSADTRKALRALIVKGILEA
ncbi:MAG: nucleotidyltransferase family protein [Verrucomicrobiota bacterium]